MYQALYRKWRPAAFDDVCGQEHITEILKYETAENRISHAYLFCGPRGTGKTSCAKILAKAINCLSPENGNPCGKCAACRAIESESATDVLEMDAASNNGVDAVRAIRDEVAYTPSGLKYRVYIVDEVHMLSISAFNALLKTLEEPPAHVVFILATTELQKLPATIVSRCQRFDFRRIATDAIVGRLLYIAKQEKISLTEGAARILAKHAAGGMRDAISLLDLCSSGGETLDEAYVTASLGINSTESLYALVRAVRARDYEQIFEFVRTVAESSVDLAVSWQDLLALYRDMLVVRTAKRASLYLDVTEAEAERLAELAALFTPEELLCHLRLLDDALVRMQRSGSTKRMIAEMTLIKLCDPRLSDDPSAMLARIAATEEKIARLSLGIPDAPVSPSAEKTEKVKVPVSAPADAAAPADEKPMVQPAPAKTQSALKPLGYWLELVEALSKENRSAMGMRDGSRGYADAANDRIVVRFADKFTMKMMSGDAAKATLAVQISTCEGRNIPPERIAYEYVEKRDADGDDFFDKLDNI